MIKGQPFYSMCQNFLQDRIMFHYVCVCVFHILFIHSCISGHLTCFCFWATVNNTYEHGYKNIFLRSFLQFFWMQTEMCNFTFNFWGMTIPCSPVDTPLYLSSSYAHPCPQWSGRSHGSLISEGIQHPKNLPHVGARPRAAILREWQ